MSLRDSTMSLHDYLLYISLPFLYVTLHYSTMALLHSTWLYITLPCFYVNLLHSIYHGSTWLYFSLHDSNMSLACLYFTLHYYTSALLHSTSQYITLPWLYFTLLGSILLYHSITPLYFIVYYSTMVLCHSTFIYITLKWLHFTLHDSKMTLLD